MIASYLGELTNGGKSRTGDRWEWINASFESHSTEIDLMQLSLFSSSLGQQPGGDPGSTSQPVQMNTKTRLPMSHSIYLRQH